MKIYLIERFIKVFHADGVPTSEKDDILSYKEVEITKSFKEGLRPAIELGLPHAYFHIEDDLQNMIYRYHKLYIFDADYLPIIQERYKYLYNVFYTLYEIEYARHYISHGHNYYPDNAVDTYRQICDEFPWMSNYGASFPFERYK